MAQNEVQIISIDGKRMADVDDSGNLPFVTRPVVGIRKTVRGVTGTNDIANPAIGNGQDFSNYRQIRLRITQSGATNAITAIVDYSLTVAGAIYITSTAHGLVTGDTVTIAGTTSYNGSYSITVVDTDNFYVTATYVADEATGTQELIDTDRYWNITPLMASTGDTVYTEGTLSAGNTGLRTYRRILDEANIKDFNCLINGNTGSALLLEVEAEGIN